MVDRQEGAGSATDMTPFFRRDPKLSNAIRERVVRAQPVGGTRVQRLDWRPTGAPSGVPTPGTSGTLEGQVNRGADGNVPRSGITPGIIGRTCRVGGRDDVPSGGLRTPSGAATTPLHPERQQRLAPRTAVDGGPRPGDASQPPSPDATPGHDPPITVRVDKGATNGNDSGLRHGDAPPTPPPSNVATPSPAPPSDSWRGRSVGRHENSSGPSAPPPAADTSSRDVPRRIIDGIGGARISHGDAPANDAPKHEDGTLVGTRRTAARAPTIPAAARSALVSAADAHASSSSPPPSSHPNSRTTADCTSRNPRADTRRIKILESGGACRRSPPLTTREAQPTDNRHPRPARAAQFEPSATIPRDVRSPLLCPLLSRGRALLHRRAVDAGLDDEPASARDAGAGRCWPRIRSCAASSPASA